MALFHRALHPHCLAKPSSRSGWRPIDNTGLRQSNSFGSRWYRARRCNPPPDVGSSLSPHAQGPQLRHRLNPRGFGDHAPPHFRPWDGWAMEHRFARDWMAHWGAYRGFVHLHGKKVKRQTSSYLHNILSRVSVNRDSSVFPGAWATNIRREADVYYKYILEGFSPGRESAPKKVTPGDTQPSTTESEPINDLPQTGFRSAKIDLQSIPQSSRIDLALGDTDAQPESSCHRTTNHPSRPADSLGEKDDISQRLAKYQPHSQYLTGTAQALRASTLAFCPHDEKLEQLRQRYYAMQNETSGAVVKQAVAVVDSPIPPSHTPGQVPPHTAQGDAMIPIHLVPPESHEPVSFRNGGSSDDLDSDRFSQEKVNQTSKLKQRVLVFGSLFTLAYLVGIGIKLTNMPSESTAASEILAAVHRSRIPKQASS